jgi:zinc/manganese transport system permease protein
MIEFLALPALACVALVGIHAYFGLHVLRRNVIFVDLALAQVAALGATAAFILGHLPQSPAAYGYSLAFTLVSAAFLASTRRWSDRIPQEALIGVLYVVAAAAALLLVDRAPQGAEHIRQILTGNILTVGVNELAWAIALYLAVGLAHPRIKVGGWLGEFLFYASFGLVVTSSVALAGVLLVFAFLIIPAAIGVLHAQAFGRQLLIAWGVGTGVALAGLVASYTLDLSTGATLVCAYGIALLFTGLARARSRLVFYGRWVWAIAFALSAFAIAAFPRSDQPLLDAAEYAVPRIRAAYMEENASRVATEAEAYAQRYRGEAARLREKEAERRWKGEPLDELEVRRVASFLKSYNEMIKGETFVMREVRSRARAERRFAIALVFLALGVLCVPWRSAKNAGLWRWPPKSGPKHPPSGPGT